MADSIYNSFIDTKINIQIPQLISGRTLESKYNPERDAENIISTIKENYDAFLILGIGSGILAEKIHKNFPNAIIFLLERSQADLQFLKSNQDVKKRISDDCFIEMTINDMEQKLINNYLPAKYGDLKIIEQKNWIFENQDSNKIINDKLHSSLASISADFSVQSHFGKLWTNNILRNIQLLSEIEQKKSPEINILKTAYIIAAGPTLDETVYQLKNNTDSFIISTDTAFQTLQKHNIVPDVVVSLDGQHISHNHFFNAKTYDKTLFLFDLTSDFSSSKYIKQNNLNISFFVSGHPLSNYFNSYINNSLFELFSGAGTVTITALDLAIKMGFKKITILGADFSYSNGKAYTKGTYLDLLYNKSSNKIQNNEYYYDKLLFRTELIALDENKYTTTVLDSYKKSLLEYLSHIDIDFCYKDSAYQIRNNEKRVPNNLVPDFSFRDFILFIKKQNIKDIEPILLPFIAYQRKHYNYSKNINYNEFLQLAHSYIVSYN